ncbi:tRNA pseudouridine65 synthase [Sinobacterium caligoides]|uniref:tRNA pseudouridine synthase C n=1 Tax=Sinobacterium caligoides TaxID=933926 RepID=A0A3N2DYQ1_9GAMM|nr:pseudouridine synthase [Sinobacterium caligoides]ROS04649.1 tRNA pseudouridine65 synthase [Sinobacterium caligoides]
MLTEALQILYQDDYFVAVHKPAGLLVHRSNIDPHETSFLLQRLRDQLDRYLYPIHRLDKPTSGLILFAFDPVTAAKIQAMMAANEATKEYLLVCRGYTPESGFIDHAIRPIDEFKHKRKEAREPREAQEAQTEYRRLATVELPVCVDKYPASRYSLVLAKLLTGRKHQLRRHFKHLSHPIIGCPKYGKSSHNHYFAEQLMAPRLLLHSYRMAMKHPQTGESLLITCAPGGAFRELMARFNWLQSVD